MLHYKVEPRWLAWQQLCVAQSFLGRAILSIQDSDNEPNNRTGWTGNKNAEQRTLIRLLRESDRAKESDKKSDEAQDDGTSNAVRNRSSASAS